MPRWEMLSIAFYGVLASGLLGIIVWGLSRLRRKG